jgi:hypothetical protein
VSAASQRPRFVALLNTSRSIRAAHEAAKNSHFD